MKATTGTVGNGFARKEGSKMNVSCKMVILAAVSFVMTANAETVFTADFRDGLPGWSQNVRGVVLSVEAIEGENALVIRRDPKTEKRGTEWSVVGEAFPVKPGDRLIVDIRARSSIKDLRFCKGFRGEYITGLYWYDRKGNRLSVPFGMGYELIDGRWRDSVAATVVPDDAVTARLGLGMDSPDMKPNEWIAISSVVVDRRSPNIAGSAASLRDDGMVLVDGKPFFPIGIYGVWPCERNGNSIDVAFRDLKAAGFNMVHRTRPTPEDENEEFLSLADKHGLKVFTMPVGNYRCDFARELVIDRQMRHPSVLAWYVTDDTSDNGYSPEEVAYRTRVCKAYDPARLTLQADLMVPGRGYCRYNQYVYSTDVFLPEIYPVARKERLGCEVAEVAFEMERARESARAAGNPTRSIWPIIQHFRGWGVAVRFPDFDELRAMSWEGIVHGGNGIIWYLYHSRSGRGEGVAVDDRHWREITAVSSEIASLSGDLLVRNAAERPDVEVVSGPAKDYFGLKPVSVLLKAGETPQ